MFTRLKIGYFSVPTLICVIDQLFRNCQTAPGDVLQTRTDGQTDMTRMPTLFIPHGGGGHDPYNCGHGPRARGVHAPGEKTEIDTVLGLLRLSYEFACGKPGRVDNVVL